MNSRTPLIPCASLLLAGMLLLPACGGDDGEEPLEFVIPSDADAGAAQRPQVTLSISDGDAITGTVVITLVPEHAPTTVANFLAYVNSDFYDGTIIHRYDANFVFQGGGYVSPVSATDLPAHKPTNAPIPLELRVSNVLGTVAMARTSVLDSATSEFFINLVNNDFLDISSGGYAAFGYISDMTFVNTMKQATCVSSSITSGTSLGCLPLPNLVITSAEQTR